MKKLLKCTMIILLLLFSCTINNTQSKTIRVDNIPYQAACSYSSQIAQYSSMYVAAMKEFGVPASVLMAIAINESSFGQHNAAAYNFHGVKNGLYPDTACATFETYNSAEDGIRDVARLLGRVGGSYDVTQKIIDYRETNGVSGLNDNIYQLIYDSIEGIYCTDGCGDYIGKIETSMTSCNLKSYDSGFPDNNGLKSIVDNYYGPNKVTIPGYEKKTDCSASKKINNEEIEKDHFYTSQTGDLSTGWLFERFEYKEITNLVTDFNNVSENIDEVIDEIFYRAKVNFASLDQNGVTKGMSGTTIYGRGIGSPLPDYIKNAFDSPFGSQSCSQSGCFGYYFGCATHSGADLTSSSNANIYSAYDGVITFVNSDSRNCPPKQVNGQIKCTAGCSGNIVTVKHTVNGATWYTKYVHMASLDSNMVVGNSISKGQKIGIIGTSGCSTGIHLHFEIIGPDNKLYNPEELLAGKCNLKSECNSNRIKCGG